MIVVHLTASTFFGGPERQMLELARSLPLDYQSVFLSFAEGGRCQAFLDELHKHRFEAQALKHDTPHLRPAIAELAAQLKNHHADVLCCHGYKADILGRVAVRRVGIPVVSISRGWTRENLKVRVYEAMDRFCLRWMDHIVCVSEGQARKVRHAGVPEDRIAVIRNAIRAHRFGKPDSEYRTLLQGFFSRPRRRIVGAAGRLSPEKGFSVLVDAAALVARADPTIGFVLFGDGSLRGHLERQIAALGLEGTFILAGFRTDLDRWFPALDLLVLPSFTEGMPNVVLEAFAAGVPVVATAVGGTPEVIEEGANGYLVPAGEPDPMSRRILEALDPDSRREALGRRGRQRVRDHFTFEAQSLSYQRLFQKLTRRGEQSAQKRELPKQSENTIFTRACLKRQRQTMPELE